MNNLIDLLQNQDLVWQGNAKKAHSPVCLPSGFAPLDQQLGGGFPQGVNEIQSVSGIGELRLLIPALMAAAVEQRLIVFIASMGTICSEMLTEQGIELEQVLVLSLDEHQQALWAAEQCLRSGACHSVVMWTQASLAIHQVKRLQVACDVGNSFHFILREKKLEGVTLPFDLSLSLVPHQQGVLAKINKRKRGWPSAPFLIDMSDLWPALTFADSAVDSSNSVPYSSSNNVLPFSSGGHVQVV
ncbi:translesion DNA synthesis-associated protein ImuA [Thalassotalea euphylliae]|uniref:Translesion DNA synthesis-associated protein ImuA n=1 Tax=Thalassotalea euphylliae TaxID=1655234 RepID=A0A3E0TXV1_9GAMM|nr:translesion DNA synthesis-associated protein ImuA [Thalassotalea euphylliae]REL29309.1 translesion DNA synthesis-associated protein ImuA [Thalassotalea euphylliae]